MDEKRICPRDQKANDLFVYEVECSGAYADMFQDGLIVQPDQAQLKSGHELSQYAFS